MKLLRRNDYSSGKFTLAFVGYGDESASTVVELTYNWDTHKYDVGNGFGHLALGVDDIYQTCDELGGRGAKVIREPGPRGHGGTHIAFIEDRSQRLQNRACGSVGACLYHLAQLTLNYDPRQFELPGVVGLGKAAKDWKCFEQGSRRLNLDLPLHR